MSASGTPTALHLGRLYDTKSRDLISEAVGNPRYHTTSIPAEAAMAKTSG
jgi:glucose/mannose-6-phosphate isomerase